MIPDEKQIQEDAAAIRRAADKHPLGTPERSALAKATAHLMQLRRWAERTGANNAKLRAENEKLRIEILALKSAQKERDNRAIAALLRQMADELDAEQSWASDEPEAGNL